LAKETISPLLGEGANKELTEQIEKYVLSFDKVLGCHDLLVHDYGPGNRFASLHVEMDKDEDALNCHEILDEIERVCLKEMGINLVIHFDPVVTNDPVANELKIKVENVLSSFDNSVSLHDFRVRTCDDYLKITFDVTIPQNLTTKQGEILEFLQKSIKNIEEKPVLFDVTFDVATYN
jgi:divalent metal cation (Fe/Co/Zn/Cd) transporter